MKKLLRIAGLLVLTLPVAAQASDYIYTTNNGTVTITKYIGSGGDVTIPETLGGLPVASIGSSAFHSCTPLTSITIPSSVTSIGSEAFYSCTSLTSITIPSSVVSIGDWAFYSCTRLTSVTLPDSVTSIGSYAFFHCTKLTSITIPSSITSIGYYAFYVCTSLTSVTIPNSVTNIGAWAFHSCGDLTSITIPSSVTSVGSKAFYSCAKLTEVYFKGNAPVLQGDVFTYLYNGALVYYLPDTTGWESLFGGYPTMPWNPQIQTDDTNFGLGSNGFGFTSSGDNYSVVVEACTNLSEGVWSPVQTNIINGGTAYFNDSQSTNYLGRFYRLRMP